MALIFESKHFLVEAPDQPHLARSEGGHIKISPKERVLNRQALAPVQAIELARLTTVVGQAMQEVLVEHGVDIGRINYQDNGNWSVFKPEGPYLHIHLYGRAKSAKQHPYGQACYFPHPSERPDWYADLEPLTAADRNRIRNRIGALLLEEIFSDAAWGLSDSAFG